MKKTKIVSILISSALLLTLGGISQAHSTKNKNEILLSGNKKVIENACVENGNGDLVLKNSNGQVISYLSVGEMLDIHSTYGNTSLVTVKETGSTGYISNQNSLIINSGDINNISPMDAQGYIINVSSTLNLRETPSMNGKVIKNLKNNTQIKILGKTKQWYKVSVNGTDGFVFAEYVAKANNNVSNSTINKNTTTNVSKTISKDTKSTTINTTPNSNKTVVNKASSSNKSKDINTTKNNTDTTKKQTDTYSYAATDSGSKLEQDITKANAFFSDKNYSECQKICKELLKNPKLTDNPRTQIEFILRESKYKAKYSSFSPEEAFEMLKDNLNIKPTDDCTFKVISYDSMYGRYAIDLTDNSNPSLSNLYIVQSSGDSYEAG